MTHLNTRLVMQAKARNERSDLKSLPEQSPTLMLKRHQNDPGGQPDQADHRLPE